MSAIADLTEAIRIDPKLGSAYHARIALLGLGRIAEANKDFAEAKRLGYRQWKLQKTIAKTASNFAEARRVPLLACPAVLSRRQDKHCCTSQQWHSTAPRSLPPR